MPKIDPRRVRVRRRWWILLSKKLSPGYHGWCYAPDTVGKQIQVSERLRGRAMLETLLHELFHAGNWEIKEESVLEFCHDVAKILYDDLEYRAPWDLD